MPKSYERVRDSYVRSGKPLKEAKKLAAMWYNKHHKRKNPWRNEGKKRKPRANYR